jgi:F0F1-type ATP synthase assembly protein I
LAAFISRGALLAGLPFLSSYFTFSDSLNRIWYWPFLWLISLSLLFDLHSERSGEEKIRFSRWNEISVQHGERFANVLMIGVIIVVASTGVVSMFLINLFPSWVIIIILMLLTLLIVPPYFKYRRDRTGVDLADLLFHGLVHAFAIGLMLQFLLPALVRIIRPGCF